MRSLRVRLCRSSYLSVNNSGALPNLAGNHDSGDPAHQHGHANSVPIAKES
jgi:hypothetical protein